MAIDFPSSPNINDTYTVNGRKWVYDGAKWVLSGSGLGATTLDDLSDVTVTSAASNNVLSYNSSISQWVNTPAVQVSTRDIEIKLLMEIN